MDISQADLAAEYQRAQQQWPYITDVNDAHGLPVALLYALGSRETNLTNEIGDFGHGHGVFQLDDRSHTIPAGFDDDVRAQAETAAGMMADGYQRFGDWTAACNYYNSGSPDTASTTGGDYGPDVMDRQAYLATIAGPPTSVPSTNRVTVARNAEGGLEAFVVGGDGALYHAWQTSPGGGWTDWSSLGGQQLVGGDGVLYHAWQTGADGGWGDWSSLGGQQLAGGVAVAANADGRLEVFVIGGDGVVYHKWQTAPNGA